MSATAAIRPKIRLVKNGRVIDPANGRDAVGDVHIDENGFIAAEREADAGAVEERQTIDAADKWVIPGLVDLSARFREPGDEHKADIASESRAALGAGLASVCIPPDTAPVIDTPAVADLVAQKARPDGPRLHIIGAATVGLKGKQLSEMAALKAAGCIALGNGEEAVSDNRMLRHIMDYAAGHRIKLFLRPQDAALSAAGCAHEGRVAERLGLPGIPAAAETIALGRDIALIEATGAAAHFCRLSTARAVDLVADARRRGLNVTADVSAHQLFLTDDDIAGFNPDMRVSPPLRTAADRDALRRGVAEGVISAICSDHQPHEADAKLRPFPLTAPGASALEAFLPLLLQLAAEDVAPLQTLIAAATCNPAAIINKPVGALNIGAPADIAIINPRRQWVFHRRDMLSRGKNSPFDGRSFTGKVTHTIVGGNLVYGPSP